MIRALKRGNFILPNGGRIIKAYGYVYGLVDSIIFTLNQPERLIIYNYAEEPLVPLREMVKITKRTFNYNKPTLSLSVKLLAFLAWILNFGYKILGKKTAIHPVRVRKAGFPTNIKPEYLIRRRFEFRFDFETSLTHWKQIAPEDFIK
jgi:hypothetical protein